MLNEAAPKKTLGKKIGYGVLVYLGVILILVVILAIAADSFKGEGSVEENGFSSLSSTDRSQQSLSGNLIPPYAPVLGPANAKITIVEFSDFGCPFCQASFPVIRQVLNKYPDDIRLVYRHMPLRSLHPIAEDLAHASMCAKEQGKFWVMHDRIFQNQASITKENIAEHARAVGLDVSEFQDCQDSGRWNDEIQQDLADAVGQGGRGTPTWVVNGQLIQGFLPFSTWEEIIQQLL